MADAPKTPKEYQLEIDFLRKQLDLRDSLTDSQWEYIQNTKESMEMQKTILGDAKQYLAYVKKTKELEKDIAFLQKQKALAVGKNLEDTQKIQAELDRQIDKLKAQKQLYEANLQAVSKTKMLLNETVKGLQKLPGAITSAYGKLKGYGLFEMDKAVKNSALSMGLLKKRSDSFYKSIGAASNQITAMGGTIEDATKMQSAYSEEIGRSVLLGAKNLVNITAIAKGTGMGADEAAKMAAEFEQQGMSVERVAKFMKDTMNDASKLGLNSSKVIKNISTNMKMLNKYNFKGGVQGFKKMAETVTKLGINMNSVAGMADKLMNIDGAVEMSAKLQVLGGKWSQLADPFKLMYMARNDMEGLTKAVADAASENARLDKDGNIQLAAVEMSRLREVAEATGVELETLVTAGKNMAKFKKIRTQMSVTGLNDEEKEFLENTSQFNDKGQAYIEIDGKPKLLSQLGSSAKTLIQQQIAEKDSLEARAKAAMTFDDQIKALIEQIKVFFLPFVKTLAEKAAPAFEKVRAWFEREKIGERLERLGKWLAEKIGGFLEFAAEHPYVSIATLIAGKAAMWLANGALMATGFRIAMGGFNMFGKGGMGGPAAMAGNGMKLGPAQPRVQGLGPTAPGARPTIAPPSSPSVMNTVSKNFGSGLKSPMAKLGGGIVALTTAFTTYAENQEKGMGAGENAARTGLKATGAGLGAWGGAAAGAAIGTAILPGIGTIIGGLIGGGIGANYGGKLGEGAGNAIMNDGIIKFNDKDKFMKVNDSTMIAGTKAGDNGKLAKSIMSMYGTTPGAGNSNKTASVKVDEMKLGGTIDIKINGESTQQTKEIGKDLMTDPLFLRQLSLKINEAANRAFNGKTQ
jgi:uncharacterized phage-associated protein